VTDLVLASKVHMPRVQALRRPRLERQLAGIWTRRLAVLTAPAGSGKTTLLAQFAASAGVPVAWYRVEPSDASTHELLAHLHGAFVASGHVGPPWASVEEAVRDLEGDGELLLVIDDLHALPGAGAGAAFLRFLALAPSRVRVLAGARRAPDLDLSRFRISGELLEFDAEDLRFRSWEVAELFRDYYGEPMRPEDLALLLRHTEGWAAGLQLFHLATAGKLAHERRRVLTEMRPRAALVRDYLTRNVLAELPSDVVRFLVDTSVLDVLTGELCDTLLGVSTSAAMLEWLEHRQVFVQGAWDGSSFRYHEVLRGHLEAVLCEELGEAGMRERYRTAAALLEAAGHACAAVRAYSRAADWTGVQRLLGCRGEELATESHRWLSLVPPGLIADDPWLQLATARAHRASGHLGPALESYQKAAALAPVREAALIRREATALAMWRETLPRPGGGWMAALRRATARDPLAAAAAAASGSWPDSFVRGMALLLAGDTARARETLQQVGFDSEPPEAVALAAHVAFGITVSLGERGGLSVAWEPIACSAERAGLPWLARLARICGCLDGSPDGRTSAASLVGSCEPADAWGNALGHLLLGLGRISAGAPDPAVLDLAAERFRALGAGVLESWARSYGALALAATGDPDAPAAAASAEAFARSAGVHGPHAIAFLALGRLDPEQLRHGIDLAEQAGLRCGVPDPGDAPAGAAGLLDIRCFGGFEVSRDGVTIDLSGLRPRARTVLHVLALHPGRPVHWEVIASAAWPDVDSAAAGRAIQVAVSSIRRVLDPCASPRHSRVLVREGEAYRVVAGHVDIADFDACVEQAEQAHRLGSLPAEAEALHAALKLYRGPLLPGTGPAEWVVTDRELRANFAAEIGERLAVALVSLGRPAEAADAARRAIALSRERDGAWRALFSALQASGDQMSLRRSQREYRQVLDEMLA